MFFPEILEKAKTIGYLAKPLYDYRRNEESTTFQAADKRNKDVIKAWKHVLNVYQNSPEKEFQEKALKQSFVTFLCRRTCIVSELLQFYQEWRKPGANITIYLQVEHEQLLILDEEEWIADLISVRNKLAETVELGREIKLMR